MLLQWLGAALIIRCALTRLRPHAKHCVTRSTGARAKKKKRSAAGTMSPVPCQGAQPGPAACTFRYFSAPAAQIDAATAHQRKSLSAAAMPAGTSPHWRSRVWDARSLYPVPAPVPRPDIPLFSLFSSARAQRGILLCLFSCFSRVCLAAANHLFLFYFIFPFIVFLYIPAIS